MEIKRVGERRDRGTTILLEETAISTVRVDGDRNIEIIFKDVKSPTDRNTAHEYFITLTPADLGKIMAEVYKQALTKSK
jgi:hypothetical protein